jgi:hypothetical protein
MVRVKELLHSVGSLDCTPHLDGVEWSNVYSSRRCDPVRSSAPGIGPAGHGRANQASAKRLLAPKARSGGSLAARVGNGAGRGRHGIIRGCPLGTGRDRCECTLVARLGRTTWQPGRRPLYLDRRVRPVLGDQLPRWQAAKAAWQVGTDLVAVPSFHGSTCLRAAWATSGFTDHR